MHHNEVKRSLSSCKSQHVSRIDLQVSIIIIDVVVLTTTAANTAVDFQTL